MLNLQSTSDNRWASLIVGEKGETVGAVLECNLGKFHRPDWGSRGSRHTCCCDRNIDRQWMNRLFGQWDIWGHCSPSCLHRYHPHSRLPSHTPMPEECTCHWRTKTRLTHMLVAGFRTLTWIFWAGNLIFSTLFESWKAIKVVKLIAYNTRKKYILNILVV